jgi:hypothetical protein
MSDNITKSIIDTVEVSVGADVARPQADEGGAQTAVWLSQADVQALEFLRLTLRIPARGGPRGGLQGRAGALVAAIRIASKSAAAAPKAALIAAGFSASEATRRLEIGKRSAETRARGREVNARRGVATVVSVGPSAVPLTLEQHKAEVDKAEPFFAPEGSSSPRAPEDMLPQGARPVDLTGCDV